MGEKTNVTEGAVRGGIKVDTFKDGGSKPTTSTSRPSSPPPSPKPKG